MDGNGASLGGESRHYRVVRRIVVAVLGGTVLLFGALLIVLPGPAFLVIPAGLAILATEFAWARLWLRRARRAVRARMPRRKRTPPPPEPGSR
jgi:uncharacterized protein (TIGR02611 family)